VWWVDAWMEEWGLRKLRVWTEGWLADESISKEQIVLTAAILSSWRSLVGG
jgi:hypothetical protein